MLLPFTNNLNLYSYITYVEILAYEKLVYVCSGLCRANQLKIANILLKDVFITKDLFVERARVLTWKAIMTTTNDAEPLKECVRYLSESIFFVHFFCAVFFCALSQAISILVFIN